MCLAGIELLATIPLATYLLVEDIRSPIYEWKGLKDLHYGFSRVDQVPLIEWINIPGNRTYFALQPWLTISCGLTFFVFFGLAEEARTHYRLAFTTVAKKLGITTGAASMSSSSGWSPSQGSKLGVSIPSFVQRSFAANNTNILSAAERRRRRDTLDSFSDQLSTDISIRDLEAQDEKGPYSPTDSMGSSTAISTPIDGTEEKKLPELVRPDSGVVVADVEVITNRRSVDVPRSVRDSSHMV
jgi:pheromone a factor receptor